MVKLLKNCHYEGRNYHQLQVPTLELSLRVMYFLYYTFVSCLYLICFSIRIIYFILYFRYNAGIVTVVEIAEINK
jgi:hypothetical protein